VEGSGQGLISGTVQAFSWLGVGAERKQHKKTMGK